MYAFCFTTSHVSRNFPHAQDQRVRIFGKSTQEKKGASFNRIVSVSITVILSVAWEGVNAESLPWRAYILRTLQDVEIVYDRRIYECLGAFFNSGIYCICTLE